MLVLFLQEQLKKHLDFLTSNEEMKEDSFARFGIASVVRSID